MAGRPVLGSGSAGEPAPWQPSTFTFNASAPEFVPRGYQPVTSHVADYPASQMPQQQWVPVAPHMEPAPPQFVQLSQPQSQPVYQYSGWSWEVPGSNDPVSWIGDAITCLTQSPASFDDIMHSLCVALNRVVHDSNTVTAIVDMIFEQSLLEPNFRYTGARICNYFGHNFGRHFTFGNFRGFLLSRCQKEHSERERLVKDPNMRTRLIGFTLFLGELLLNLKDTTGDRIPLLAQAIQNIVSTLLDSNDEACLKCVVQVLKLTGATIEELEKKVGSSPHSTQLDVVFDKLKQRLTEESTPRNLKAMLLSVVELRACTWGMKESEIQPSKSPPQPSAPQAINGQMQPDTPVYYDSNGQPLPIEAAGFINEEYSENYWAPGEEEYYMYGPDGDDFDEEIAAAYEQFLAETGIEKAPQT